MSRNQHLEIALMVEDRTILSFFLSGVPAHTQISIVGKLPVKVAYLLVQTFLNAKRNRCFSGYHIHDIPLSQFPLVRSVVDRGIANVIRHEIQGLGISWQRARYERKDQKHLKPVCIGLKIFHVDKFGLDLLHLLLDHFDLVG